jgi:hypothetical protein
MADCHEMRKGQVYMCEECGLELQVVAECKDAGTPSEKCQHNSCDFACCDQPLKLKS